MVMTWDEFVKQVNEKGTEEVRAYELDGEDFEDHYEEAYDMLLKAIDKVDFSLNDCSSDNNATFAMSIFYKTYPGGRQVKRKNKQTLFDQMVKVLNKIKDKPLKYEESCAGKIIDSVGVILSQADLFTQKYLEILVPIFNQILQQKVHSRILQSLFTFLFAISTHAPDQFVIIGPAIIKKCFEDEHWDYLSMMANVAEKCPDEINKHIPVMMELIEEGNRYATNCPMVLQKIAARNPELLVKYLKILIDKLTDMMGALYSMIIADIATKHINEFGPYMDKLLDIFTNGQVSIVMFIGKIINSYYKDSNDEKKIKEIFSISFARLKKEPDIYAPSILMCISDFSKCSLLHKNILKDNHYKELQGYLQSNGPSIKVMVEQILNHLDDKTLDKLGQRIDKQDENIEEVKADVKVLDERVSNLENIVEEHKKWVKENLDEIKINMAKIGKVLPIPVNMTIKSNVIDTIYLHFICSYRKDNICVYPGDNENLTRTFNTSTKEINKWLKIGVQAVSLGFKVFNGDIYNGLGNIKNMYDIYSNKKEDKFETWTKEPFLTSSEQDELILQLRKSSFYSEFTYDPEHGGWCCNCCLGKSNTIINNNNNNNDDARQMINEVMDTTKNVFTPGPAQPPQSVQNDAKETKMNILSDAAEQVKELQESSGCKCAIL